MKEWVRRFDEGSGDIRVHRYNLKRMKMEVASDFNGNGMELLKYGCDNTTE